MLRFGSPGVVSMFVKYGSAPATSSIFAVVSDPVTFVPPALRLVDRSNCSVPAFGKLARLAVVNLTSNGTRMRCGASGEVAFS